MSLAQLEREVRLPKGYAILSTVALIFAFSATFTTAQGRQRFTEIDVERVNIVEPDGRLTLAIANTQRLPGPMIEGKELAKERGEASLGARRVFLGSQDQAAALRLMDTNGRERVRITVDATNPPRMDFLDEGGKVVFSLPR